jgi:hypothetical protein
MSLVRGKPNHDVCVSRRLLLLVLNIHVAANNANLGVTQVAGHEGREQQSAGFHQK